MGKVRCLFRGLCASLLCLACTPPAGVPVESPRALPCQGRMVAREADWLRASARAMLERQGFVVGGFGRVVRAGLRVRTLREGRVRLLDTDWPVREPPADLDGPPARATLRVQVAAQPEGHSSCLRVEIEPVGFAMDEQTRVALAKAVLAATLADGAGSGTGGQSEPP